MFFDCNILCIGLAQVPLHANLSDNYWQKLEEDTDTDHLEKIIPHRKKELQKMLEYKMPLPCSIPAGVVVPGRFVAQVVLCLPKNSEAMK
jgi:hypothetical protein